MRSSNIATTKNNLSQLLRRVRRGESVLITDRKRPVAVLAPLHGAQMPTGTAAALVEAGVLQAAPGAALNLTTFLAGLDGQALPEAVSLQAAIGDEREDGR